MDPITHALSGAVIGSVLPSRMRSRWLPLWAAVVAASPDIDVFFIANPLEYIEYHRGITHSFVGAWALALLAGICLLFLERWSFKKALGPGGSVQAGQRTVLGAWLLAYMLLLHHLWLDCMNSYGTQVFLPFSDYRVRWNALFIVDPILVLPLLFGVLFRFKRFGWMLALVAWTFVYPLSSLMTRVVLEERLVEHAQTAPPFEQVREPGSTAPVGLAGWDTVQALALVPDAFTPFHWKLILDRGESWAVSGYSLGQTLPTRYTAWKKPPEPLWAELGRESAMFHGYQRYAAYPMLEVYRPEGTPPGGSYIFSDLRFGSTIPFVEAIQTGKEGRNLTFRIMARVNAAGKPDSVRLITTTGAGGDSGWQPAQR